MRFLRILTLGCVFALGLPALAQFQWIDHNGRRVFSDRPPPTDIPSKNVIKGLDQAKPSSARADSQQKIALPATQTAAAPQPATSGTDEELERKKREADRAEAQRKKAEDAKQATAKAENCRHARETKATLESGTRMVRVNQLGERVILNDAQRAEELKRANAIIAESCQ